MKSIVPSLFLFLLMGTLGADEAKPGNGPEDTARIFYSELRRLEVTGLPDEKAWPILAPFLSKPLLASMERARVEQAEYIKKFPDEKPPWIEGDLFSSLFEGPRQFQIRPAKIEGETAEVPVDCVRTEGGDTAKWSDTLLLKKTPEGWRIDDVRYGGTWDFANSGTLQEALAPETE